MTTTQLKAFWKFSLDIRSAAVVNCLFGNLRTFPVLSGRLKYSPLRCMYLSPMCAQTKWKVEFLPFIQAMLNIYANSIQKFSFYGQFALPFYISFPFLIAFFCSLRPVFCVTANHEVCYVTVIGIVYQCVTHHNLFLRRCVIFCLFCFVWPITLCWRSNVDREDNKKKLSCCLCSAIA